MIAERNVFSYWNMEKEVLSREYKEMAERYANHHQVSQMYIFKKCYSILPWSFQLVALWIE